jgi:hypothetical protein
MDVARDHRDRHRPDNCPLECPAELEDAPTGADSVAWGWGPGSHSDEPYGEEPWDSPERSPLGGRSDYLAGEGTDAGMTFGLFVVDI